MFPPQRRHEGQRHTYEVEPRRVEPFLARVVRTNLDGIPGILPPDPRQAVKEVLPGTNVDE